MSHFSYDVVGGYSRQGLCRMDGLLGLRKTGGHGTMAGRATSGEPLSTVNQGEPLLNGYFHKIS